MNIKNIFRISNILLIILGLILFIANYQNKEMKVDDILQRTLSTNNIHYRSISKYYKVLANNINAIIINDAKVIGLFNKAQNVTKQEQVKIRQQLYSLLEKKYKHLRSLGFRQIHFHLPDNTSFLRMHKPEKFGDDLSDIRHSVKKVNETLKPVNGFEEGRIVNGFRYVYPMFNNENEHIGSVETSISSYGYIKLFQEHYFSPIHFIIKKSEVDKKVFTDEIINNYIDSTESSQYYRELISEYTDAEVKEKLYIDDKDLKYDIEQGIETKKAFVLYTTKDEIISFIPVKNIKDKEVIAYFSIYTRDENINHIYSVYRMINITIFLALLIILYLLEKDIKNRKKILKQKLAFETLFEKSSDGMLIIENGKFTQCNEKVLKMLKIKSKEEVLGMDISKLSPKKQPDGRNSIEKIKEMIDKATRQGTHSFEWVHIESSGKKIWVEVVLTPITLSEIDVLHVVWRDIKERKQMEVKLQEYTTELELRFNALAQANLESKRQEMYLKKSQSIAHSGVWEYSLVDDKFYWSDEVYKIFGLDKQVFKPTQSNILQYIHSDDIEKLKFTYSISTLEKQEYYFVHRIIRPDGLVRYIEERGNHSYNEAGKLIGTIGVALDITQKKELELELLRLNKNLDMRIKEEVQKNKKKDEHLFAQSRLAQMGEMISMIAHQWRQPLAAISATSANLETKIELEFFDLSTDDGKNEQNEYFMKRLMLIDNYVDNLTTTIDDFRNFYKPNKAFTLVTFEEVTNKALAIIQASLENNGIKVIFTDNSRLELEMYDNEMMQVILNIFKNAQDNFLDKEVDNPQIEISIKEKSLSIKDNGGGVPLPIIEKIFDPYFSTKDEKNGSGLGLYMSKIIVEEHHRGKLLAENTDEGICFMINLTQSNGS